MVQKPPKISFLKLQNSLSVAGVRTPTSTLSQRFNIELGLKSYKPPKKTKTTSEMAKKRLEFAKRFINYSTDDWNKVMGTDERTIQ